MSNNYETLELDKNGIMLQLPSIFSHYAGSFFYYQARKVEKNDNSNENYYEYCFHLNKCEAKEKNEFGDLLPILMCHITREGFLPCPDDILHEIKKNNNRIIFYSCGFSDFILTTKTISIGLTDLDEDLIIKLWNND